jgi:sortase (surface protein transpeptidase)
VTADLHGALAVPDDPLVTGWWNASARPGAPSGSVVIDGHVDSATRGLGAFFKLGEVHPGDRVVVINSSGQSTPYTVVARRRYAKAALPAREIFTQAVSPRLVLVTCGGPFNTDTGNYLNNVVIYAEPT